MTKKLEKLISGFAKKDKITEKITNLLTQENKKRSQSSRRSSFDSSSITECPRKLVYNVNGHKEKIESIFYFDMIRKKFVIKKWQYIFEKCIDIRLAKTDHYASDGEYNIGGIIDAVIEFDGSIFAVKIYNVEDEKFNKISKSSPLRRNIVEVVVDLWLSELSDGLIIYENTLNGEYCIFHIEPNKGIINSVKELCLTLTKKSFYGSIPERPYKEPSAECNSCEFKNKCYNK